MTNYSFQRVQVVNRAQRDTMAARVVPLTRAQEDAVTDAFFAHFCTERDLRASVLQQINSQPDGSPGLRLLRDHIFQALALRLAAVDGGDVDRTLEAVALYYQHKGLGNPSDHRFTDLNELALDTFVTTRWPGGFTEMCRGTEAGEAKEMQLP